MHEVLAGDSQGDVVGCQPRSFGVGRSHPDERGECDEAETWWPARSQLLP